MLIFDLGANHGEDTARYLHYADKVVSVEANPVLAGELRRKFAAEMEAGQLELVNVGVWSESGKLPFYKHANDHWSSFDPAYGLREGGHEIIEIETVPITDLFERYGVPNFLKIDIEGADRLVLQSMLLAPARPRWISVEEYGPQAIRDLSKLGYQRFKIVPQARKYEWASPADQQPYSGLDSGPPPWDTPGAWLDAFQALTVMEWFVRDLNGPRGNPHEWYDVHGEMLS